ncbi:MAG TPA: hypothetical protein VEW91_00020, partial [bacterium]|nr:hypothetical protein [bacterium]
SGVAFADQPDTKVWEIRLGVGHGSTFGTVSGAPQVNGIAGQLQYNFAPHLFLQGTVLYQVAGNVPGGAFGFVILGYQFP